jgi:hypothetical protein
VCLGGGAFKFKAKKKNHGVFSEMTESFGSKRLRKERQGNYDGQIESRATTTTTTSPTIHWKPFMTYLRMTPTI